MPTPATPSDNEWAFMASYFPLITADASQWTHRLREVFNELRWLVRSGPHGG
jgi:hypothetical protein